MRLFADPVLVEEFDTVVDELTDQYIQNELQGEDRERVEKYFLNTNEGQQKLAFASELLRHASEARGQQALAAKVTKSRPSLWEQLAAFWKKQSFAPLALTAAALVLAIGLYFVVLRPSNPNWANYPALSLTISTADRAGGSSAAHVQLPDSGLKINLNIPEPAKDAQDYRVKLISGDGTVRDLEIKERKEQTLTVAVPADSLTRGAYVVQLFKVNPGGAEERVRGSYYFDIE